MPEYISTHTHSSYSFLDGAANIKGLVSKAKSYKMDALALTDHGFVHGLPEFQKVCDAEGIKPILGVELYFTEDCDRVKEIRNKKDKTVEEKALIAKRYHQIVIAKNAIGVQNLHKLASWAATEGFYYYPTIDFKRLKEFSEGLIVTSSCISGIISRHIVAGDMVRAEEIAEWFQNTFGNDFYFEVHNHGIPEEDVIRQGIEVLSEKMGIPVICCNDIHYVEPEDYEVQDALMRVKTGSEGENSYSHKGLHFASPREMESLFHAQFPDSLENTQMLADSVEGRLPFTGTFHLPEFKTQGGLTERQYLQKLCDERLPSLYPGNEGAARKRLKMEMDIIDSQGFVRYFLIVQDITTAARRMGVWVGPGRGSAAGSIVAYLTGITNIDPLLYDLLFERFLNPSRVSMPDIDLDFDDEGRSSVIDYIVKRYGRESVMQIVTFGRMGSKTAVRDIARAYGVPLSTADILADKVPNRVQESEFAPEFLESDEVLSLVESDAGVRDVYRIAPKVFGFARQTGVHAAGVVITPGPVSDFVPIRLAKETGGVATQVIQYEGKYAEGFGLLKMDILGLMTLSILKNAVAMIKTNYGNDIDLDKIPLDDLKTFRLFQKGATDGFFQFESDGMKRWLKELEPDSMDDLIAMNALFRPGPMDLIPSYVARKHGREKVVYPHACLQEVLDVTYGIPVFQEQIMSMARVMAGFSLGDGDILRRAMGKKDPKEMASQRTKFVKGAKKVHGVEERQANDVFDMMDKFSGYGFNRSHSAAYSVLAYQTAYLKAHYPVEFMASVLESNKGKKDKDKRDQKEKYLQVASEMGIVVTSPNVNRSEARFIAATDSDGVSKVFYGMDAIKGAGEKACEYIIKEREKEGPFPSFADFVHRVMVPWDTDVTRRDVERLILVGAFDGIDERACLLERLPVYSEWARKMREVARGKRKNAIAEPTFDTRPEEMPMTQRLRHELENMGQFVSCSPLDTLRPIQPILESICGKDPAETTIGLKGGWGGGTHVRPFLGYVTNVSYRSVKKGKNQGNEYALMDVLVQVSGVAVSISVWVWPEELKAFQHLINTGYIFMALKTKTPNLPADTSRYDLYYAESVTDFVAQWTQWVIVEVEDDGDFESVQALFDEPRMGGEIMPVVQWKDESYIGSDFPLTFSDVEKLQGMSGVRVKLT